MLNMDEKRPLGIAETALMWLLVLILTAVSFVVVYFIWRNAFEVIFFTVLPDRFVARLFYLIFFVGLMSSVALMTAFGEMWMGTAMREGRHWKLFLRWLIGLILFGAIGELLSRLIIVPF